MSTTDERECDRCGRRNPAGRAIDPPHDCPHGVKCVPGILHACGDCLHESKERANAREKRWRSQHPWEREAEVREQAAASLDPSPLAAIGGTPRSGVAAGPAGVVKR